MAISTDKSSIFKGTYLDRNFANESRSRAVRVIRTIGGTDNVSGLNEAIDHVKANFGGAFPGTALPLLRARADGICGDKTRVAALYQRDPALEDIIPGSLFEDEARFIIKFVVDNLYLKAYLNATPTVAEFDSDGIPDGDLNGVIADNNPDDPPVAYGLPFPVVEIHIPTFLDRNPTAEISSFPGKVNSDSVTWGGFDFPPNQLRFEGARVDPARNDTGGLNFAVQYVFTAKSNAWKRQLIRWNTTTKKWVVDTQLPYQTAAFAGQFPSS